MVDLGTLGSDPDSVAGDVNDHGQIIGVSVADGATFTGQNGRGLIWNRGRITCEVVFFGGPGGYVTRPPGETHTMWNAGSVTARMIEVISPAGFEHFLWGEPGPGPAATQRALHRADDHSHRHRHRQGAAGAGCDLRPAVRAAAGGRVGIDLRGVDHDTAVHAGWLTADQDWVSAREPVLAVSDQRGGPSPGMAWTRQPTDCASTRLGCWPMRSPKPASSQTAGLGCSSTPPMVVPGVDLDADPLRSITRRHRGAVVGQRALALELLRECARVRPQEAIREWADWASDWDAVLGRDHPDTLASRNNLAVAHREAGDLDRAIPLFEETLADREQILGPDDPDTLASQNNLAYAYQAVGNLDRAIPLFAATLDQCERLLGVDHPRALDPQQPRRCLQGGWRSGPLARLGLRPEALAYFVVLSWRALDSTRRHPRTHNRNVAHNRTPSRTGHPPREQNPREARTHLRKHLSWVESGS